VGHSLPAGSTPLLDIAILRGHAFLVIRAAFYFSSFSFWGYFTPENAGGCRET
jgi:hypothetical protein